MSVILGSVGRPAYYGNPAGVTDDVDIVRAVYDAFARRDLEGALAYIAPTCELHLEGTARAIGRTEPYVGHDGMREYFGDVARVWEELTLHAEDIRVVPGSVVVIGHVSGVREGRRMRRAAVWTWRLSGGKATYIRAADMGDMAS
jgi:ketosteroid isomerase-like protein